MTRESRLAYSEIVEILGKMDQRAVEKVPLKLREYFTYNKLPDYVEHINEDEPLKQQNLMEETITILAMLNLRYWTTTEQHKNELIHQYNHNEKQYQENYSTDNMFKNRKEEEKTEEIKQIEEIEKIENIIKNDNKELKPVVKKQSFIQKIINKIKKWFKTEKKEME